MTPITIQQLLDVVRDTLPQAFVIFAIMGVAGMAVRFASYLIEQLIELLESEKKAKNEAESIHRKLKNEDLVLEEEKPKRGRMMIGDDGELLEIVEEEFEE